MNSKRLRRILTPVLGALAVTVALGFVLNVAAEEPADEFYRTYIYGAPKDPGETWRIASGGRLYDVWWAPLEKDAPQGTHPSYPKTGKQSGSTTWRCVECHGWDYRGAAGVHGRGAHYTGVKGIQGMAGADPAAILKILRDETHRYTPEMIPDEAAERLTLFVSKGQIDMSNLLTPEGKALGDAVRGRDVYQNLCAICHGYDGRAFINGEDESQQTLAAVASRAPFQSLHKIVNGEPSADMLAMRAIELKLAIDILAYAQTLE